MDVQKIKPSESYATDFFFVNRWMLRCAGLWTPESKNKHIQLSYKIYAIIVFVFVNLWFTFTEFVSLFYTSKNEDEFIKNVNFFLTHFMGAVKVIFWYFKGNFLRGIMNSLENSKLQYENYLQFKPGNLSREYKTLGIKYSLLFLSLAHATLMSSYVPPLITTLKYINQEGSQDNTTVSLPNRLPYYSWMPFPYNTGNLYLLAVAYQAVWTHLYTNLIPCLTVELSSVWCSKCKKLSTVADISIFKDPLGPMFSYAYSIVGMDTLFMNIMNCIAGNVKIIQGACLTLRERCDNQLNNKASNVSPLYEDEKMITSMNNEMNKIIKHLQTVFKACDDLERVHRYVTLCQVTATLFILCTCLYLVSMELPSYIYESNWLATNTSYKKTMMFTMMRAKRPVYLTAGKFSPLTLPTFMSIIKTSYSIFALIKNTAD